MKPTAQRRGRPPRERLKLIAHYRALIASGRMTAGRRLPSREQLAAQHGVSLPTAQQAMAQLEAEGWIVSRGRQGTFVADRPPHQGRYALVLPYEAKDMEYFSLFYQALTAAAARITQTGQAEFAVVHAHRTVLAAADEEQLLAEVRAHRIAGLIFADYPMRLKSSRLFRERDLFHTAITFTGEYLGAPATAFSQRLWFEQAVAAAVTDGRSRVACLSAWPKSSSFQQAFLTALAQHDLEARAYWQQHGDPRATEWVSELTQLWMALPAADRPDTLLIADDNFVEPTTAGLAATGVTVPDELLVIGHFNHPCRPVAHMPVRWLGYDCLALLRQARAVIDAQRRGDSVSTLTALPAVWGEDVDTKTGTPRRTLRTTSPIAVKR